MCGRAVKPRKRHGNDGTRNAHLDTNSVASRSGVTLTLIAWQWRRGVRTRLQHEFELLGSSHEYTATSSRICPLVYCLSVFVEISFPLARRIRDDVKI